MLPLLRLAVELVTNLVMFGYVLAALLALLRGGGMSRARLLVVDGILFALNFKVVATLLRTVEITTWNQIGLFAAVFVLRTLLKRVVNWERREMRAGHPQGA